MQENGNADRNSNKTSEDNHSASPRAVWTIAAVGVVGVLAIGFVAIVLPNMTERIKFFTTNTLSILVLDVIVIQAYIYSRQREAMQSQLHVMRDTMIYAQRAYVCCTERRIVVAAFDKSRIAYIKIRNFGNTPASNVRIFWTVEFKETVPVPCAREDLPWIPLGLIPPNDSEEMMSESIIPTDEQQAALSDKSWDISLRLWEFYCWGIIQYTDIFGVSRETEFCFAQHRDSRVSSRVISCPTGNKAT